MPPGHAVRMLRHAALLWDDRGLTDAQLLASFIERRDEAAFAALVRRHGSMVLGVCRRVLRDGHAAEDAFQATFLVLVRKAASLRSRELVANWLYGTAYRTALEAKAAMTRRRSREAPLADVPDPRAGAEIAARELRAALDQELSRLPEKYRLPVVLCDLEGGGRREVARLLNLSEGTLSSRLARARRMLAGRLARHGLAPAGAPLAVLLAEGEASARVPAALAGATTRAALLTAAGAGLVPAEAAALAEGVLRTMMLTKVKTAAVVLLGAAVLGLGTGGLVYRTRLVAAEPPEAQRADGAATARERDEKQKLVEEAERFWREARVNAEQARARAEEARRRAEEAEELVKKRDAQLEEFEKQLQARRDELQPRRPSMPPEPPPGFQGRPPAGGAERDLAHLTQEYKQALDALESRRAELMEELRRLDATKEKLTTSYAAKQAELEKQLKEAPAGQAAPGPSDRLGPVLERLERIEKRLDRLEQGRH